MKNTTYDTETTGLYPYHGDEMFSYSLTDDKGKTTVHRLDGSPQRQEANSKKLDKLFSNKNENKIMHNAKFDLTFTEKELGRDVSDQPFDCTHKMHHIVQNNHYSHKLDDLGFDYFDYDKVDKEIRLLAKQCGGYQNISKKKMDAYQIADGERTMLLFLLLDEKLDQNPQWRKCYEVERDLIIPTMRAEKRGLMINRKRTEDLVWKVQQQVDEVQEQIYALVGSRFNIASDDELRRILFKKRGLPTGKLTEKSKVPSVDKYVLMDLKETTNDPLPDMLLRHKAYRGGVTTLESYLDLMDGNDIIHPSINTCAAITGRQSCSHPNLQNVQKTGVLLNPYPVPARHAFRPRPEYINIHVDYSGIEMRLLIHYSKEPRMIDCLLNGDGDVHSIAAEVFYGDRFRFSQGQERKTLRGAAKNADFGCPYGAGGLKIVQTLGLSNEEGWKAFRRYVKAFPNLVGLTDTISEWVMRDGFVTSAFGRRLYVPRSLAYTGTNYLIQGTAGEMLKRAQIKVHNYNENSCGGEVRMLLPIHDEIIIEYPRHRLSDLDGYLKDISALMVDFDQFDVPMEIEAEMVTYSWEHKEPLPIPK